MTLSLCCWPLSSLEETFRGRSGRPTLRWEWASTMSPMVSNRNLGTQTHQLQSHHCCHTGHHLEKGQKHIVSAVSLWPSSSGLGETVPFQFPDPSYYPLHRLQPVNLPNEAGLTKPRLPGRNFYFQNDSNYALSICYIPDPNAQYSIEFPCNQMGQIIPILQKREQKLKDLPTGGWAGLMPGKSDSEWQQYVCPMYLLW